jgi:hypothetical protein
MDHCFDPDRLKDGRSSFRAGKRGAYYGGHDRLRVFDALGLFRVDFGLVRETGPRLLVLPGAAEEPVSVTIHSGGQERRTEPRLQRTDNLIDHRPYVPGDDPRKINWKLYGHAGDLFVRDGEPEPPPHSRLVILVDTQTDPALYSPEAGRGAVDTLCEQALALVREYAGHGMETLIGYTGSGGGKNTEVPFRRPPGEELPDDQWGGLRGGAPGELAAVLACPAALPLYGQETYGDASTRESPAMGFPIAAELPAVPDDRGILVLALPRRGPDPGRGWDPAEAGALDRFLKARSGKQAIDLLFLYTGEWLDGAAEENVLLYNRKGGVHARRIRL